MDELYSIKLSTEDIPCYHCSKIDIRSMKDANFDSDYNQSQEALLKCVGPKVEVHTKTSNTFKRTTFEIIKVQIHSESSI